MDDYITLLKNYNTVVKEISDKAIKFEEPTIYEKTESVKNETTKTESSKTEPIKIEPKKKESLLEYFVTNGNNSINELTQEGNKYLKKYGLRVDDENKFQFKYESAFVITTSSIELISNIVKGAISQLGGYDKTKVDEYNMLLKGANIIPEGLNTIMTPDLDLKVMNEVFEILK
ncbi:hypothetical protein K9L67_00140 [Candidatus Woesearchaeota archaeon]|nr:hypothetical protein [Candidatus Woesearchaeota archaeon]MCF7900616.1 hypothetical protein [Candidatus Woesearchaeota archaeon]MCF8013457.1 hypothetical protein [Candidatus Woesearchaeota archaeon]